MDQRYFYKSLEKALRAFASSSGGAVCPGGQGVGVRGQPRGSGGWGEGSTPGKCFVTNELTD